jgi:hypothetical protein
MTDVSHYGQGIGTELFGNTAFNGSYATPSFDASVDGSSYVDTRKTVYAATRLNLADPVKLLLGAITPGQLHRLQLRCGACTGAVGHFLCRPGGGLEQ